MLGTIVGLVVGIGMCAQAYRGDLQLWSLAAVPVLVLVGVAFPMTVGTFLTGVAITSPIAALLGFVFGNATSGFAALGIGVLSIGGQLVISLIKARRSEPMPSVGNHPYVSVTGSPLSNPSGETFFSGPVQFRTDMAGVSFDWRQGSASVDAEGLRVTEPRGGEFIFDWGFLHNVEVGHDETRNVVTGITKDGTMVQVVANGEELPMMALATWATLRDCRIEKGGGIIEFHPGGYQMPSLMRIAGQWGGGEVQARAEIRNWLQEMTHDVTYDQVLETRESLSESMDVTAEDAHFWDVRAKRLVQDAMGLLDEEMRDVTITTTHAGLLGLGGGLLAHSWIAVTDLTDLWVLYFPALDRRLRISDDLIFKGGGLPEYSDPLASNRVDCQPGVYFRFDLSAVTGLEVVMRQDGLGCMAFINWSSNHEALTNYTNTMLPPTVGLCVFGEQGWEGVKLALEQHAD